MASPVTEEQLINQLAAHCREIDGIKNAYGFASNPDELPVGVLPAILFYPRMGEQERKAHPNRWTNSITIDGLLFVTQRMQFGGNMRFIENAVLPFAQRFRQKFQEYDTINAYQQIGAQVADFKRYAYTSGGLLMYMDIQYVGYVLTWEFRITS
jgi:hypothetical protein